MKPKSLLFAVAVCLLLIGSVALAHFQVLVPSSDIVGAKDAKTISFDIIFTHPMANGPVMEMGAPKQFGVLVDGKKTDLLATLQAKKIDGKTAYASNYEIKAPGDYVFFIEPAPYWEPAEEKMIIHYTKVVVDAFDAGEGWEALVGLPVEIEPLTRPYGLWTGNLFRGIVRKNGQPVPFAEVEVEYRNQDGKVTVPADPFTTQVVKADANGVFAYAMPRAGWWSFAALIDGDEQLANPDGKKVDVELGALIWVKTVDLK